MIAWPISDVFHLPTAFLSGGYFLGGERMKRPSVRMKERVISTDASCGYNVLRGWPIKRLMFCTSTVN